VKLLLILAVCAAALVWAGPGPPRGRPPGIAPPGDRAAGPPRRSPRAALAALGRGRVDDAAAVGAALTNAAARLRAGQSPTAAWAAVAQTLPDHLARPLVAIGHGAHVEAEGEALAGAQAANRLARELGAELAPILESCAEGIEEAARARTEREAAFAAPQATAKLLLALPLAGVAMAALLGARPWELFLSGPWGALLAAGAGALTVLGRVWIARLVEGAARAGEDRTWGS